MSETTTISSKYQIVIPKKIREQLSLKPGQIITLFLDSRGIIMVDTQAVHKKLSGKYSGAWGSEPDDYIKNQRNEWDNDASRESR